MPDQLPVAMGADGAAPVAADSVARDENSDRHRDRALGRQSGPGGERPAEGLEQRRRIGGGGGRRREFGVHEALVGYGRGRLGFGNWWQ